MVWGWSRTGRRASCRSRHHPRQCSGASLPALSSAVGPESWQRWDSLGHYLCCCCGQHVLWGRGPFPELLILVSLYPDTQAGVFCFRILTSLCLAGVCLHSLVATALPLISVLFPSPRETFFCCYNYYCCSYRSFNTKPPIIITEKVDGQKEQEKHHKPTQREPWAALWCIAFPIFVITLKKKNLSSIFSASLRVSRYTAMPLY